MQSQNISSQARTVARGITLLAATLFLSVAAVMALTRTFHPAPVVSAEGVKENVSLSRNDTLTQMADKALESKEAADQEAYRFADAVVRENYFQMKLFRQVGTWILLVVGIVFIIAGSFTVALGRQPPDPTQYQALESAGGGSSLGAGKTGESWVVTALIMVAAFVLITLGGVALVWLSLNPITQKAQAPESYKLQGEMDPVSQPTSEPTSDVVPPVVPVAPPAPVPPPIPASPALEPTSEPTADIGSPAAPTLPVSPTQQAPPSNEATATLQPTDWSRFRGNEGLGVYRSTGDKDKIPTSFNIEKGENILWKVPVPLLGYNSPVIVGDRIFLTGADKVKREIYCYDLKDGKLLWSQEVPSTEASRKEFKIYDDTGYAAPTVATDGQRVFAIFPNGDLAAYDFTGKLLWEKHYGILPSQYGYAASLLVCENQLIIQLDLGAKKDKLSKLLSLDTKTGEQLWETPRDVPNSWSSPTLIEIDGKKQIITLADPYAIAYDTSGKEIWRAKALQTDVGPSPVFFGDTLYIVNQFPALSAVKATGTGDVSKNKDFFLWQNDEVYLPDMCCPLVNEKWVVLLESAETLTCVNRETGELAWEYYFEWDPKVTESKQRGFTSSPSLVDGMLYVIDRGGVLYVLPLTGEEPESDAIIKSQFGENCYASPAFTQGKMVMRGVTHLICIGKK